MYEYINHNFRGATITIGFTGIPAVVTGEVLRTCEKNIIELRVRNGNKIFINADLIAFAY